MNKAIIIIGLIIAVILFHNGITDTSAKIKNNAAFSDRACTLDTQCNTNEKCCAKYDYPGFPQRGFTTVCTIIREGDTICPVIEK
jgi:hypothetical protein